MLKNLLHLKTLRGKIFTGFYFYSVLSFLVAALSFGTFREMEDIDKAVDKINELYQYTLRMERSGEKFLVYEVFNEDFHAKGKSDVLNEQVRLKRRIQDLSEEIQNAKGKWKLNYANELTKFDSLLVEYDTVFRLMVRDVKYKGMKGYGLLGRMQSYIAELEVSPYIDRELLLEIRNEQKDYLIKGDTTYFYQARRILKQLMEQVQENPRISANKKERLLEVLRYYNGTFLTMVDIDIRIGVKSQEKGWVMLLSGVSKELNELVSSVNNQASIQKEALYSRIRFGVVAATTIAVILLLVLSVSFNIVLKREEETEDD